MLLYAFAAYVTILYVHDIKVIIPALLGSFCGTYLTVKFNKKDKK